MAHALQNGTTLQDGKYKIVSFLGQGGFGITYLAENTMLDKKVAIKEFFPKDFCDREDTSHLHVGTESNRETVEKLKDRFLKEARNIAKIDFPGIIKIFDIFEENNTSYYVMEYIEGENLNDIVNKNGPLSEDKAVEYIKGVGEALEHIHSKNMTHFDVKPSNIVIRKSDDKPILIDFGLSKQYNKEGEATSTLLQGVSKGYSPIELYNSDENLTFSPQTDVYSLAASLYYLLEGITPPASLELITKKLEFSKTSNKDIVIGINKGMTFLKEERISSIVIFLKLINNSKDQYLTEGTYIDYEESKCSISSNNVLPDKDYINNRFHPWRRENREIWRYYENKEYSMAFNLCQKYANEGNVLAMETLAKFYEMGKGVKKNLKKYIEWNEIAAQNGHIKAIMNLGEFYSDNFYVKRNYIEAFRYYRYASEKGNPDASRILGCMYYNNQLGYREPKHTRYFEAFKWFKKGAERDDITSQEYLGNMYYKGEGTEKNLKQAKYWWGKASKESKSAHIKRNSKIYRIWEFYLWKKLFKLSLIFELFFTIWILLNFQNFNESEKNICLGLFGFLLIIILEIIINKIERFPWYLFQKKSI